MLYLVSTPIGNLKDITVRALELLKESDYILCEDTRHSLILLQHYDIKKPLKSYHKFNESSQIEEIIQDLKEGKTISLISDAGTPGICDPGMTLVKNCIEHKLPVYAIPGPCALIAALSSSGFIASSFQFLGFLPKKESELKNALIEALSYKGVSIMYESPNRLTDTLKVFEELSPKRTLGVARELTKKFEEFSKGVPSDLLEKWSKNPPKGEIVLLLSPPLEEEEKETRSPIEHTLWLMETYELSKQEAIKLTAKQLGLPKREVYRAHLENDKT